MYVQWNSASKTTHWTALNWSCQRRWGGRVTRAFLKVSFIIAIRYHFVSTILYLIESYLALPEPIVTVVCTTKSHNGQNRCRQYKFHKSLQYQFVTSHWQQLRLHSRPHPCIHHASGQRDATEQVAADRLPVFQRKHTDRICSRVSSFVTAGLWSRCGYRGQ